MFHRESWKFIYFGVKGQDHEAQKTVPEWVLHSCECWLLPVSDALKSDPLFSYSSFPFDWRIETLLKGRQHQTANAFE